MLNLSSAISEEADVHNQDRDGNQESRGEGSQVNRGDTRSQNAWENEDTLPAPFSVRRLEKEPSLTPLSQESSWEDRLKANSVLAKHLQQLIDAGVNRDFVVEASEIELREALMETIGWGASASKMVAKKLKDMASMVR